MAGRPAALQEGTHMDWFLGKEQVALVEEVRGFAERYLDPASVALWRRDMGLPYDVVREFVNLDFKGFGVVRRNVDRGFDMLAQVLVSEELARYTGQALPFFYDMLQLQILEAFASPEQADAVLGEYQQTGRLAFALAVSEPGGGSDTMSMETKVVREGGRLVLRGAKSFVANGEFAPNLMVSAVDGTEGAEFGGAGKLTMWMIPRGTPGVSIVPEEKIGQPFLPFASIQLDDVELDEGWLLHDLSRGFSQVFAFFEFGSIFLCATALGEAQAAMEDAVAWARERKAFGTPIGQFQQIQQMVTDMEVKLTNMRNLVYKAAWEFDNGVHDRLTVAMMKRYVPAAATEVASDAMQILGGRGYTTRERVSSIWQDCRGFQIAEGTDQIMVYIAAPLIFSRYATEQPPFMQVTPE